MFHLKLIKGRSYRGRGITASITAPDVHIENQADADALVASGYFEIVPDGTPDTEPPAAPTGTITAIDAMNTAQLRAYAKKNGLDIDEAAPKGSSVDVVRVAVADALAAREKAASSDEDVTDQFSDQPETEE